MLLGDRHQPHRICHGPQALTGLLVFNVKAGEDKTWLIRACSLVDTLQIQILVQGFLLLPTRDKESSKERERERDKQALILLNRTLPLDAYVIQSDETLE